MALVVPNQDLRGNLEKVSPGNDCVMIGMFKETKGLLGDLYDVAKQKIGIKTPEVILARELLTTFADIIERTHPSNIFTQVTHSAGGAWLRGALNCMNTDQKERVRNRLLSVNIAPASCIPNESALRATNFYSNIDFITGFFGATTKATPAFKIAGGIAGALTFRSTYNVTFLESNRPILPGVDHSILYDTQQDALKQELKELEREYGFYKKAR